MHASQLPANAHPTAPTSAPPRWMHRTAPPSCAPPPASGGEAEARSEPQASEVHRDAAAPATTPYAGTPASGGEAEARSEPKASEVHQDASAPATPPYAGTPASAGAAGARSEPKASEVHKGLSPRRRGPSRASVGAGPALQPVGATLPGNGLPNSAKPARRAGTRPVSVVQRLSGNASYVTRIDQLARSARDDGSKERRPSPGHGTGDSLPSTSDTKVEAPGSGKASPASLSPAGTNGTRRPAAQRPADEGETSDLPAPSAVHHRYCTPADRVPATDFFLNVG